MINLDQLGLMTFPRASERWNKERSYVYQQYKKYPHKFLAGSTAYLNGGDGGGTLIITREGMEHLTGQTEAEASNELWRTVVVKQSSIIEAVDSCNEPDAYELLLQMREKYDFPEELEKAANFDYLDSHKKNFGKKLSDGTIIYYQNIRRGMLPDELKEQDVIALRHGKLFSVEEIGGYEIAEISLSGQIVLYHTDMSNEVVKQIQRLAVIIKSYSKK
ncbi:helix-turn-helix domain-containing protein [uncultured Enterococcus sp.]|uniref:helix-turn-helix domain-containing protein n=1 Tax=uncultured Enterococcus sp. TaxID=167972 RepID=UPI002AA89FA9|nr:helix-turn-helix domain-containing protein [uncultured Enterococcus sp.]